VTGQAAEGVTAIDLRSGTAVERLTVTTPWGYVAGVMPMAPDERAWLIAHRADGSTWQHEIASAPDPLAGLPADVRWAVATSGRRGRITTVREARQRHPQITHDAQHEDDEP
jgi:hypothetical protein